MVVADDAEIAIDFLQIPATQPRRFWSFSEPAQFHRDDEWHRTTAIGSSVSLRNAPTGALQEPLMKTEKHEQHSTWWLAVLTVFVVLSGSKGWEPVPGWATSVTKPTRRGTRTHLFLAKQRVSHRYRPRITISPIAMGVGRNADCFLLAGATFCVMFAVLFSGKYAAVYIPSAVLSAYQQAKVGLFAQMSCSSSDKWSALLYPPVGIWPDHNWHFIRRKMFFLAMDPVFKNTICLGFPNLNWGYLHLKTVLWKFVCVQSVCAIVGICGTRLATIVYMDAKIWTGDPLQVNMFPYKWHGSCRWTERLYCATLSSFIWKWILHLVSFLGTNFHASGQIYCNRWQRCSSWLYRPLWHFMSVQQLWRVRIKS